MPTEGNISTASPAFLIGVSISTSSSLLAGRGTGQDNCQSQYIRFVLQRAGFKSNKVILHCLFAIKSHCNLLSEIEVDVIRVIKERLGGPVDVTSQVFLLHGAQPILQRLKANQRLFSSFSRYFAS